MFTTEYLTSSIVAALSRDSRYRCMNMSMTNVCLGRLKGTGQDQGTLCKDSQFWPGFVLSFKGRS